MEGPAPTSGKVCRAEVRAKMAHTRRPVALNCHINRGCIGVILQLRQKCGRYM